MILDPDRWPAWPFLPMKNPGERLPGGWPKTGFFFNASLTNNTVTFYEGMIFTAKNAAETKLTVDEVLAAGWVVD